jgi:hypothetical protein
MCHSECVYKYAHGCELVQSHWAVVHALPFPAIPCSFSATAGSIFVLAVPAAYQQAQMDEAAENVWILFVLDILNSLLRLH